MMMGDREILRGAVDGSLVMASMRRHALMMTRTAVMMCTPVVHAALGTAAQGAGVTACGMPAPASSARGAVRGVSGRRVIRKRRLSGAQARGHDKRPPAHVSTSHQHSIPCQRSVHIPPSPSVVSWKTLAWRDAYELVTARPDWPAQSASPVCPWGR